MIDILDIEAAQARLDGVALHTPLIENERLNHIAGGRVLLKPECLQRTGSFKIRGAYNMLSQLEEPAAGVVAFSSGNHAQGVADAGRLLGISTVIVMPEDAPAAKLDNTRRLGGDVVTYDRYSEDRETIAASIAAESGRTVVPSYDHPHIMAGQGTAGLEMAVDLAPRSLVPDQVLVCCGGGGLTSGVGTALRAHFPDVDVVTVEPARFDDTARSLASGRRETVCPDARSICDAILTPSPGELTFECLQALSARGLSVTDEEARDAMRFAFSELKLVVEPGGAVALAAILAGRVDTRNRLTLAVLSGGNVDPRTFAEIQSG